MQNRQFEFFLIRYVPDPVRGEFINIGIILHELEGPEGNAIIRFTRNWDRLLRLVPDADIEMLEALEEDILSQFAEGQERINEVLSVLQSQLSNTVQITDRLVRLGVSLDAEADQLMKMYVESGTAAAV